MGNPLVKSGTEPACRAVFVAGCHKAFTLNLLDAAVR